MQERVEKRRAFIINTAYLLILLGIVFLMFKYLLPWLLPFVIGYVITLLLKPIVFRIVKRTKLNYKFVSCVVLLLAYGLLILLLVLGGAKLFSLTRNLFASLPLYYETVIQPAVLDIDNFLRGILGNFSPEAAGQTNDIVAGMLHDLQSSLLTVSSHALSGLASLTTQLPNFFLTLLFSIMSSVLIIMNYQEVANFLAKQVPQKYRKLFFIVKDSMSNTILKYMKAYLILMAITFGELTVGFLLLGVQYAVPVAFCVAIVDILPVLGTGTILIPWVAVSLLRGNFPLALGILLLYAVITIVRNILEPRVVGSTLGLHPLVTLISIYVGFKLLGFLGMILVPITVQVLAGLHKSGVIHLWQE